MRRGGGFGTFPANIGSSEWHVGVLGEVDTWAKDLSEDIPCWDLADDGSWLSLI